jgi:2-phospho-L-lactate/phosphoenolpyruvate guanylyltransferase
MPRQPSSHDAGRDTGIDSGDSGIVVPVRSFRFGKGRLATALDDASRIALAQRMADAVVAAAGPRPTVIVSSAPEVAQWCAEHGLDRLDDPGSLDLAADAGRAWFRAHGLARVVVVHGDLPFASSLDDVAGDGAAAVAVLVPDHRGDGTPVCAVPVDAPFAFAYGAGSFARHIVAAERAGLAVRIVRDDALGFDVDLPEDLARLESHCP